MPSKTKSTPIIQPIRDKNLILDKDFPRIFRARFLYDSGEKKIPIPVGSHMIAKTMITISRSDLSLKKRKKMRMERVRPKSPDSLTARLLSRNLNVNSLMFLGHMTPGSLVIIVIRPRTIAMIFIEDMVL